MGKREMAVFLDSALESSKKAKRCLEARNFHDSLLASHASILSTIKAVTSTNNDNQTPIDLLYITMSLLEDNQLDEVFYTSLSNAIATTEEFAQPENKTGPDDAKALFEHSILALKKAREIYDTQ